MWPWYRFIVASKTKKKTCRGYKNERASSLLPSNIILATGIKNMKTKIRISCWVRTWVSEERRWCCGAYHALMRELDDEDLKDSKNCIRMDISSFCDLLDKVRH